jgi:DHA2 family multidrug resistance protein
MLITDPPYMKQRSRTNFNIDYIGLGLLALGLGALQIVLDKGQRDDWFSSHFILVLSIVAAASLIAVVIWEWKHEHPIIDLHLFSERSFAIGNMLMFMVGFALLSSTVLLPLFLQTLMGYTAEEAGLSLMAGGFVIIAAMPLVGFLLSKYDARWLLLFGLCMVSFSLFHMTHFDTLIDFRTAATARAIQAAGLAFLFVPINTVAYAFLPKDKNNAASGLINLSRNIGGSLGISLVTTILARRSQYHQSVLSSHVNNGNSVFQSTIAGTQQMLIAHGSSGYEASRQAYGIVASMIDRQASVMSYIDCFFVLGIAVACMIPFVFLMKKVRPGGPMAVH